MTVKVAVGSVTGCRCEAGLYQPGAAGRRLWSLSSTHLAPDAKESLDVLLQMLY